MLIPFIHMDFCPFLFLALNKGFPHHWKIGDGKRVFLILFVLKNQQFKRFFCLPTCKIRAADQDLEPERATISGNLVRYAVHIMPTDFLDSSIRIM